jgi:hypothetical protein
MQDALRFGIRSGGGTNPVGTVLTQSSGSCEHKPLERRNEAFSGQVRQFTSGTRLADLSETVTASPSLHTCRHPVAGSFLV